MRFAIWVQGCNLHCPGCFARSLQAPDGGTNVPVSRLIADIEAVRHQVEGITLLGGEPFLQAEALWQVAAAAREMGLSVLTFTGYDYEALLRTGTAAQHALLQYTDVLLDGPYLEAERDFSRPLLGSKNQNYRFLTQRYGPEDFARYRNRVECRITTDGRVLLNGMGDFPQWEQKLEQDHLVKGTMAYDILRV